MGIRRRRTRQLSAPADGTVVWTLGYLEAAVRDAKKFLTDDQYAHAVQQFELLATERNPRLSEAQDIRPIGDFYELRDKGGILGKINLRAYFAVFDESHLIVVLGCYKKEDEGQVAEHIKVRIRNRLRVAKRALSSEGGA